MEDEKKAADQFVDKVIETLRERMGGEGELLVEMADKVLRPAMTIMDEQQSKGGDPNEMSDAIESLFATVIFNFAWRVSDKSNEGLTEVSQEIVNNTCVYLGDQIASETTDEQSDNVIRFNGRTH